MAHKVIITSDSTCDLSKELLENYGIVINPLTIILGAQDYRDGVDVTPDDIYDFVAKTGQLPKTAAANITEYEDFFRPYVEQGYQIVHFTISSQMSGSFHNSELAAATFPEVYAVDSQNLSTGIGLLVLRAAELAREGLSAKEIYEQICALRDKVDVSFVVDTLEYLYKGGRCSSVAKLGANLLQLKPCIEVKKGAMGVGKKYRGKIADVVPAYIAQRLHDPDDIDTHRVFVTHSGCPKEMEDKAVAKVKELMHFDEILVTRAGCSVSTHCGPNTLGVLFIRKSPICKDS